MKPKLQDVHKRNVEWHSGKRAHERYGIWLESDIFLLTKSIRLDISKNHNSPDFMLLYNELKKEKYGFTKTERSHYLINWRSKYIWIVWNSEMNRIHTFMPLENLINRIGYMSNSVIGFLMSRNLIDINYYKLCDVKGVHYNAKPSNIIDKNSFWVARNTGSIFHHLNHNQLQQLRIDLP